MKWDIQQKALNDVLEVFLDPRISAGKARLTQRIEVGAAGGQSAEQGLQQPGGLCFAASGLRMDQPGEVEAWREETGDAGEDPQNGPLKPTDREQANPRQQSHNDLPLRVAGDPCPTQPLP